MKEEGDWSSEMRLRVSARFADRSIIPEWASLPPELVQGIAYCVLATTGGVDTYTDMRAVCPSWRSAITKPSPHAAFADHRFRPRHWVMLDLKSESRDDDDDRLFLHVPTGRFRRLRLPVLRDHLVLTASDGLIVLRDREHPRLARVLNPFTGDMLHFAAPLWERLGSVAKLHAAVSGGARPALLVWRKWDARGHTVLCGDPTSAEFTEGYIGKDLLTTMVTFQGSIYLAGQEGSVLKLVPAEHRDPQLLVTAQMSPDADIYLEENNIANSYLVESAGELLLVRHRGQALKVFRVDVKHKLLEEVKSISCRALFLGAERCVSVDANMLPSIDSDCIYMFDWVETHRVCVLHVYNLRDATMDIIYHPKQSFHEDPWVYSCGFDTSHNNHHVRPLSLIQVLLDYCNGVTQF
ncbi:hypothetical protein ACQ4PT_016038 [Festuca glaucescens]